MQALHFAVFCRVIDNVGDAGVCWRLARQLAHEHGCDVTLFVDKIDVMRALWPADAATVTGAAPPAWWVDGVHIKGWPDEDLHLPPDTVLLCTFGCELPPGLRSQIAANASKHGGTARPCWINVEHLSAEAWIESAHRRPSIKPSDGAREYYFFPGFTPDTGGLLREADLSARQAALIERSARESMLQRWGAPAVEANAPALTVSLFCYPVDVVGALLECLAAHRRPVRLLVPEGIAAEPIRRFFGRTLTRHDGPLIRGPLQAVALPWLDQRSYDELLYACDLNFVRGEDSWIRAHWSGRPFIWQPYPQHAAPRRAKLDAWLDRLTHGWPAEAAAATRSAHHAWIGDGAFGDTWPAFAEWALSPLGAHYWNAFQLSLRRQPDLATQLVEFTRMPTSG